MDQRHEVWERHHAAVRRFAMHLTGRVAEADDFASEAFVRLWTTASPVETDSVRAYLFAIVRNLVIRQRGRTDRFVPLVDEPEAATDIAADLDKRAQAASVRRALGTLSEIDRHALLMRHDGDLSYADIGRVLGVSTVAARVRVHRAHRALLKVMTTSDQEVP